jgi:hypothetical protein
VDPDFIRHPLHAWNMHNNTFYMHPWDRSRNPGPAVRAS